GPTLDRPAALDGGPPPEKYSGIESPRRPRKPAENTSPPGPLKTAVLPMLHRGNSLPFVVGVQTPVVCGHPVESVVDDGAESIKSRSLGRSAVQPAAADASWAYTTDDPVAKTNHISAPARHTAPMTNQTPSRAPWTDRSVKKATRPIVTMRMS